MNNYKLTRGLVVETKRDQTHVRPTGDRKVIKSYGANEFRTICARVETVRWRMYYKLLNWLRWEPTNL